MRCPQQATSFEYLVQSWLLSWRGLEGVILIKEVYHWGVGFEILKTHIPSLLRTPDFLFVVGNAGSQLMLHLPPAHIVHLQNQERIPQVWQCGYSHFTGRTTYIHLDFD